MSTVKPQSELMKQAMSWVADQIKEKQCPPGKAIDEAGMRFNLSPNDQNFLKKVFSETSEL